MTRQTLNSRPLPRELRLFCAVVVISTLATWTIVLVALIRHAGYPYNWPFFKPGNAFHDFYDYFKRFRQLHTSAFFDYQDYPFTYLAPGAVLYRLFYLPGVAAGLLLYLVGAVALLWAGCLGLYRSMLARGISKSSSAGLLIVALVTSYPIFFCLERGNLEIILAAAVALGLLECVRGRTYTAAVIWGVAGSVKLYPLLILALFLSSRQFRQFLVGVLSAVVATFASLLYIGPDLRTATSGILFGLSSFVKIYSLAYDSFAPCSPQMVCLSWRMGFDHSIFNLIKSVTLGPVSDLPKMLHEYLVIAAIVALMLYLIRVRKLPMANQLLFLTVCSILLPPTSSDYTLVQLYLPFAVLLLIACDRPPGETSSPGLAIMLATLALIFTPTNFVFISGVGVSGQLKCLLLIFLLLECLWFPIRWVSCGVASNWTMAEQAS